MQQANHLQKALLKGGPTFGAWQYITLSLQLLFPN